MTTELDPHPAPRRGPRPFATPGLVRLLAAIALLVALGAPIAGVADLINGATQAHADVRVTVDVTNRAALQIPLGPTPDRERPVAVQQQERWNAPGTIRLALPDASTDPTSLDTSLETPLQTVTLRAWDSTVPEQLLGRADTAVLGLCVGLGAWLLRGLLLSIADANPFQPGNARRIAGIAALVVVAAIASQVFPAMAGAMVLDRIDLGPGGPVAALGVGIGLGPILAALVLLALAEAFRRGSELARDVEGLV
jgi:hypothetical protein